MWLCINYVRQPYYGNDATWRATASCSCWPVFSVGTVLSSHLIFSLASCVCHQHDENRSLWHLLGDLCGGNRHDHCCHLTSPLDCLHGLGARRRRGPVLAAARPAPVLLLRSHAVVPAVPPQRGRLQCRSRPAILLLRMAQRRLLHVVGARRRAGSAGRLRRRHGRRPPQARAWLASPRTAAGRGRAAPCGGAGDCGFSARPRRPLPRARMAPRSLVGPRHRQRQHRLSLRRRSRPVVGCLAARGWLRLSARPGVVGSRLGVFCI